MVPVETLLGMASPNFLKMITQKPRILEGKGILSNNRCPLSPRQPKRNVVEQCPPASPKRA
ncbi:unnamed protein product [Acanthoscelides obtectus]|uniref:Uncharacterized protein n=1 Tax=Acanthoscelides obtectus TaxID=200917 RepID=A0A9P0K643_ACAOB|nr:unnamed protein product [Acanthoscelides obtectus]CAK1631652.1 hypothetical protein AOBTE_LOCUS7073 [Acanthoscelides obtectus]